MKQYQIVKQHGNIYVETRSQTQYGWTRWVRVTNLVWDHWDHSSSYEDATWWWAWTAKLWIKKEVRQAAKRERQSVPKLVWGPYP